MDKPKHSLARRWFHWINFPLLGLMVWSGLLIYWADQAWLRLPTRLAESLGIPYHLAEGMGWHFFLMVLFALNGIAFAGTLAFTGQWREMVPDRTAMRNFGATLLHELGLRQRSPVRNGKYNPVQQTAYFGVVLMGLGSLMTGLAIYKPVQLGWLTAILGGYETARLEHFCLMIGFVLFFGVHVIQVARAGYRNFRAMVAGYEQDPRPGRNRFVPALLVGLVFFGLVAGGVHQVRNGERIGGAPAVLRNSFLWNEALWSRYHSNERASVAKTLERVRPPRVNGDLGLRTPLDGARYTFQVESGERRLSLPLSAVQALPKTGYTTDFRCIEGWSEILQYAGARFSDFMRTYDVGRKADGTYYRYVGLETPDREYYVSIDIESMLHPQTVLAYEMNLNPLRPSDGAPLRLIIPIKYGIKHLKRIGRIFFSDERPPDYWAEQGYDWWSGL
jgi:thiosulfate reductase cytochrome b subunit/DMSO/TMAO reductase YedYZ molybdopterin-dependent catalytic subunit